MLNPESVKKYFGQRELCELREELNHLLAKGETSIEAKIDKLLILVEQALYPAWFDGYLNIDPDSVNVDSIAVIFEPKYPDGWPDSGSILFRDGESFASVRGYMDSDDMVSMLSREGRGGLISPLTVVRFIMSNPTLLKGLKYWVKQQQKENV